MAPAKKAASKRASASRGNHQGRVTTPKQAGRYAEFDSAQAEEALTPLAFRLDGELWDCWPSFPEAAVTMLRSPVGLSTLDFVTACVQEPERFTEWMASSTTRRAGTKAVFDWLFVQYFGAGSGK